MKSLATILLSLLTCLASPALAADGDILERQPLPADAQASVVVESLTYESDGLRIAAFLGFPADAPTRAKPLPCLIFNRGGNRDFSSMTPERFARLAATVCPWGYILVASNYRGGTGSEGADEFGGADVNDVINALRIFDQLPFADATRIGMWGHSRGGMMTYLALTRTNRIKAAIVGAGMADLERSIAQRPEMETNVAAECVPDWATNRAAAITARSAVRWVEKLPATTPILLIHGTADWRVDPRDAMDMAQKLYEAKRPFRLMMFEGADHGISEFKAEYHEAVHNWLDTYVRDANPLPNLQPHGD